MKYHIKDIIMYYCNMSCIESTHNTIHNAYNRRVNQIGIEKLQFIKLMLDDKDITKDNVNQCLKSMNMPLHYQPFVMHYIKNCANARELTLTEENRLSVLFNNQYNYWVTRYNKVPFFYIICKSLEHIGYDSTHIFGDKTSYEHIFVIYDNLYPEYEPMETFEYVNNFVEPFRNDDCDVIYDLAGFSYLYLCINI